MAEDRRSTGNPVPCSFHQVLNEAQRFSLRRLEAFGWILRFIRQPPFQENLVVLVHPDSGDLMAMDEDGNPAAIPELRLRA